MSETNGAPKGELLKLPVDYGGVSIGQGTARVGLRIAREKCDLVAADAFFVGKRLDVRISLGRRDDSAGQGQMFEHDYILEGAADVKRIGANVAHITTGLTFSTESIDVETLCRFAKGSGYLEVVGVEELPDAADEDDEPEFRGTPSTLRATGPWRNVQLDTLFDGGILKALKKAGLDTVGALSDFTASDRRLTDIDGIGPGKAGNIEERLMKFWEANPGADDGPELPLQEESNDPPGANNPIEATTRLDSFLTGSLAAPLSIAGFVTVLHLMRFIEGGHELTEIQGVGAHKADAIAKAVQKWHAKNSAPVGEP
jgi:hypothetical protein